MVSSFCPYASCSHDVPTFGAPSCRTTSTFASSKWRRIATRHLCEVMSSWRAMHFVTGLMGARSTPIHGESAGMFCRATWSGGIRRRGVRCGARWWVRVRASVADLHPRARRSAQVEHATCASEKVIPLIERFELVRRP